MTTSTTPISLAGTSSPVSVAQELGLGLTTAISMNQSNVRTLAGVPSGQISMSNLQAKTNTPAPTITSPFVRATAGNIVDVTSPQAVYFNTDGTMTVTAGASFSTTWFTPSNADKTNLRVRQVYVSGSTANGGMASGTWYDASVQRWCGMSATPLVAKSGTMYFEVSIDGGSSVHATSPNIFINKLADN